jgi:2'-5' RNA ligase
MKDKVPTQEQKKMKAAFALLANTEIHNAVRKLAWDIHRKYHTGIDLGRLPPHISLKQPFDIRNLAPLEAYLAELASTITPFEVQLTHLDLVRTTINSLDTAVLWLDVCEFTLYRARNSTICL